MAETTPGNLMRLEVLCLLTVYAQYSSNWKYATNSIYDHKNSVPELELRQSYLFLFMRLAFSLMYGDTIYVHPSSHPCSQDQQDDIQPTTEDQR
jgi:hypothetical protein